MIHYYTGEYYDTFDDLLLIHKKWSRMVRKHEMRYNESQWK